MIKFLGILSVILFWVIVLAISPIILILGTIIFVIAVCSAVSSLVYYFVTDYLKGNRQ
jgi:hypothetical protein